MSELTEAERLAFCDNQTCFIDKDGDCNGLDKNCSTIQAVEQLITDRETALLDRLDKALPDRKVISVKETSDAWLNHADGFNEAITEIRALIDAERKAL